MTKAWVVMRTSWQFNDEFYYTDENDSGLPVKAFRSKKNAENFAIAENIKEFREFKPDIRSLSDFFPYGGIKDLVDIPIETFVHYARKLGAEVETSGNGESLQIEALFVPEKMTDEQLIKLIGAVNIRFCTVEQIDLD